MGKLASDPRQRLLDAGLKQFACRGYAGTSVHDIAEEARVTKPTLYYHFQSKEGLFQALVDQAMDERLELMRHAAPPDMDTVDQLTGIMVAVTDFARRQPDVLRLCFSVAFAAPGEIPSGFKKHDKMHKSYEFVREIVQKGLERGVLNGTFSVDELTQSYFHLIQHSTVHAVFESRFPKSKSPPGLPARMQPRRTIDLFLGGAAHPKKALTPMMGHRRPATLAKAAALLSAWALSLLAVSAQTTNALPLVIPPSAAITATNAPPVVVTPDPNATNAVTTSTVTSDPNATNAPTVPMVTLPAITNEPPLDSADVRPVPAAVKASHPELATTSPIARNTRDPHALDLQTCFQLTAIRDDSLKISMQDIYIAQAQLSQSLAALWPSFSATNSQQFLHYLNSGGNSVSILGNSTISGTRNYTSQSHVTMNYTIFNGLQNWNNLAASEAMVAAKKQTLARDYQTIYQDVAQGFYDVLQYEGDMVIQSDLIDALQARVDDLGDRVKLGRSRPSELLQAQTDLANSKETFEQQRGSLNAAKETVAFYTGMPSANLRLKDTQKFPTAAQLESYVQQSGSRPDILSQLDSLRQAERTLDSAIGEVFPTITANGDFLASQDPATNQIDGSMTLEASIPIFDGGLILGQIHQNRELVRQSRLNVEQLRRTADQDTRTAYANFDSSIAQVVVLREAAMLAAKNLEAQVDDYRRGVVSNLDVLTALQDYQNARQGLHNANMQARLNFINLHVAAGMAATGPGANNQALPASGAIH